MSKTKKKKSIPFPNDYDSHNRTSYDKPYKDSKYKDDGSGYEEFSGPPLRKEEDENKEDGEQKKALPQSKKTSRPKPLK